MASTSSLGAQSTTNTQEAQHFYDEFNTRLKDVRQMIQDATSEGELHPVFEVISKVRSALTEKTGQLPSYDRQVHEQHLKEVNDLFSAKRALLAPKPKFAFKRNAKAQTAAPSLNTSLPAEVIKDEMRYSTLISSSPSAPSTMKNKIGERLNITSLPASDLATDLHLLNLKDCIVDLRDTSGRPNFLALQVRNLHRCVILCGSIDGSAMIHDCSDCIIALQCRQFRMHSSQSMAILIATSSVATIEHCQRITFAPFDTSHSITSIQDFDHISKLEPSPNWSVMEPAVREGIERSLASQPSLDITTLLHCANLVGK